MFTVIPPKQATAAHKGKAMAGETSQIQRVTRARAQIMLDSAPHLEGAATPPSEEPGVAPPLAPEAPAPEPPAPQPGVEDRAMRKVVQLLTTLEAGHARRRGLGGDDTDTRDSLRFGIS